MTALLVVTRNAALAMGLQRHGYDAAEVRPDRYGDWVAAAHGVDAVVLELSDAVAAESGVQRLRAEGLRMPVLLVANDAPGWDTMAAVAGPATRVLPLPISLPALLAALEALIAGGQAPEYVPPPEPVAVAEPSPELDPAPAVVPMPLPGQEADLLRAVAGTIGMTITDEGTLAAAPGAAPGAAEAAEPAPVEPAPVEPEAVEPAPEAAAASAPPAGDRAEDLATALAARAHELTSVADCAALAVDALAETLRAEAAACLLPDGTEWRLAGGYGPLPPEQRLPSDHRLVAAVLPGGTPYVGAGPDAAYGDWPHLVAVPVPGVDGLLVAARGEAAFDDAAVAAAAEVARETAPLLADALAARAAARALLPYADLA